MKLGQYILEKESLRDTIYHQTPEQVYLEVRRHHPSFASLPKALIPWPYRHTDFPLPEHCPACGRQLIDFAWGVESSTAGYWERGCAGKWSFIAKRYPGWLFWNSHFRITLGRARKKSAIQFDELTGEHLDGPAGRK